MKTTKAVFGILAITTAFATQVHAGSFFTTGSMAEPHGNHTATLLYDGLVLVAGGQGNTTALSTAELYNPATGTWTATGPMTTARYVFTAVLLPNGKVLVSGGQSEGHASYVSTAELYDPATGTWTATGSMTTARCEHTATLLTNGLVLVAGGEAGGVYLSTAELYVAGPQVGLIKAVKPSFAYLSLGTNYQLQVSSALNTWTNRGSAFAATNASMVYPQYFDVDNWGQLFFRLQVAP